MTSRPRRASASIIRVMVSSRWPVRPAVAQPSAKQRIIRPNASSPRSRKKRRTARSVRSRRGREQVKAHVFADQRREHRGLGAGQAQPVAAEPADRPRAEAVVAVEVDFAVGVDEPGLGLGHVVEQAGELEQGAAVGRGAGSGVPGSGVRDRVAAPRCGLRHSGFGLRRRPTRRSSSSTRARTPRRRSRRR